MRAIQALLCFSHSRSRARDDPHRDRLRRAGRLSGLSLPVARPRISRLAYHGVPGRSEEHTSELQSPCNLVCRLLLEKKKTQHHFLPCDGPVLSGREFFLVLSDIRIAVAYF